MGYKLDTQENGDVRLTPFKIEEDADTGNSVEVLDRKNAKDYNERNATEMKERAELLLEAYNQRGYLEGIKAKQQLEVRIAEAILNKLNE